MLGTKKVVTEERIDLLFMLPRPIDPHIVEVHPFLPEIKLGAQTAAVPA